jgi:predicted amidohydrolase
MKTTIAQRQVSDNLGANLAGMLAVLDAAQPQEWVVFPEGMLSGYAPEQADFTQRLDTAMIESGIQEIQAKVKLQQCYCLFGSVTFAAGYWHNSVLLLGPDGTLQTHHKIELSALDQKHFTPGNRVTTYEVGGVRLGIQACRELLFPQTWGALKSAGAQIIFHINNAVQPHDFIWEHVLIARAVEYGIFVCSVNNGAPPQALASYLISPAGRVVLRTECQRDQTLTAEINLNEAIADLSNRTDF